MRRVSLAAWISRAIFVLLFFGNGIAVPGQTTFPWKPVSAEELALADNPAMPGDSAILLDRDSHVDDEQSFLTEYYRIKVLTEEGRRFADLEIPYVGKKEDVVEIHARTVRPDGTAAEFQGQIFDRVVVKSRRFSYQAKTFTLPDVRVGSIIEYSYRTNWHQKAPDSLRHPQSYFFTEIYTIPTMRWTLQHELYTRHARFSVRPIAKGNLQWTIIRGPAGAAVQKEKDGTASLEVRDIAPLEKEEMMPPADFYNSRVHFFYLLGAGSYSLASSSFFWSGVGRRESEDIERFIGNSKEIEQETARIVSSSDSPEVKLQKIYARVQRLRYLSYEPAKSEKEFKNANLKDNKDAEDVLRHGYGFGNEINYLFVALVRAAGMQAYMVNVADRSKGIFDPAVLDATQLDARLVNVHLPEDRFFDPATRFCPFELIPWGESGVKSLRLLASGGDFVNVPGYHSEAAVTRRTVTGQVTREGMLESKFHVVFSGQEALVRRLASYDDDDAGRRKALEDEIKGWLPDQAKVEITSSTGWDTSQGELQVDGAISIPDFATAAGRRLLIRASPFSHTKSSPFKSDKRTTPVYFPYSYRTEDSITLQFAEGFRVSSVPSAHSDYLNNAQSFHALVKQNPDGIEFQRKLVVDGFIFDKNEYKCLKVFFERVAAADAEQIVLERVQADK